MNREKEISNAALKYTNEYGYFNCNLGDVECGFEDGAKWADEHPINPWHSVKDGDLPKESDRYIVMAQNGYCHTCQYHTDDRYWDTVGYQSDIAYWMKIPELPTELE